MGFLRESLTRFILSRVANGFYGGLNKGYSAVYDPNNGMWIAGALSKVQESKRQADQEAQLKFIDTIYNKDLKEVVKQVEKKLDQKNK